MSRVLPILFNTEMVRAVLNDRKSATRRIMKPQPVLDGHFWKIGGAAWADNISTLHPMPCHSLYNRMPCHTGDILYVRETWTKLYYVDPDGYTHYDQEMYFYAADGVPDISLADPDGFEKDDQRIRWHPSIHMPKEAARIWLKVTDVRMERLQEITIDGCAGEGCWCGHNGDIFAFMRIWDSTIKKADTKHYGWAANPWIWVIKFERCGNPRGVTYSPDSPPGPSLRGTSSGFTSCGRSVSGMLSSS